MTTHQFFGVERRCRRGSQRRAIGGASRQRWVIKNHEYGFCKSRQMHEAGSVAAGGTGEHQRGQGDHRRSLRVGCAARPHRGKQKKSMVRTDSSLRVVVFSPLHQLIVERHKRDLDHDTGNSCVVCLVFVPTSPGSLSTYIFCYPCETNSVSEVGASCLHSLILFGRLVEQQRV